MTKRVRPPQPADGVKAVVAARQILSLGINAFEHSRRDSETLKAYLGRIMAVLATALGCEVKDLRIDHNPALRTRPYNPRIKKVAARYTPHANDPNALEWRPQGAEFARSHHVKTNIRGDRGQFSDVVLIKRERRREKKTKKPTFGQRMRALAKWANVKIPARKNPWPPKGARKLQNRKNV